MWKLVRNSPEVAAETDDTYTLPEFLTAKTLLQTLAKTEIARIKKVRESENVEKETPEQRKERYKKNALERKEENRINALKTKVWKRKHSDGIKRKVERERKKNALSILALNRKLRRSQNNEN